MKTGQTSDAFSFGNNFQTLRNGRFLGSPCPDDTPSPAADRSPSLFFDINKENGVQNGIYEWQRRCNLP
jgi:hypothetical protein